jgi:hypothetical protein
MSLQSISPATGEILERFKETAGAARVLRAHTPEYARTMTLEMGKPMVQAEPRVHPRQRGRDRVAVPR